MRTKSPWRFDGWSADICSVDSQAHSKAFNFVELGHGGGPIGEPHEPRGPGSDPIIFFQCKVTLLWNLSKILVGNGHMT